MPARGENGFSLVELMVAITVTSIIMVSVASFYVTHKTRNLSEDVNVAVQQNLRLGMDKILAAVRNSNYGVPTANLNTWVGWIGGFNANLPIDSGGGGTKRIKVASCGLKPLTTLSSAAAAGATTLSVADASGLSTTNKSLIYIDDNENAVVKSVVGTTITIDTDVSTGGNQGLKNAYPVGTPLCRVDVTTFSIDTANNRLQLDANQGGGVVPLADGISDMQITVNSAGVQPQYTMTLTGVSSQRDPATGTTVLATLVGRVTPLK